MRSQRRVSQRIKCNEEIANKKLSKRPEKVVGKKPRQMEQHQTTLNKKSTDKKHGQIRQQ